MNISLVTVLNISLVTELESIELFEFVVKSLLCFQPEEGQWLSLDQELVIEEGEVVGTKVPTGHSLLLEAHFEVGCGKGDFLYVYFFL